MADKVNERKITITLEQDGKKAIITLTPNDDGGTNIKSEWLPAMEKEYPQGKDVLTFQILEMLKGGQNDNHSTIIKVAR